MNGSMEWHDLGQGPLTGAALEEVIAKWQEFLVMLRTTASASAMFAWLDYAEYGEKIGYRAEYMAQLKEKLDAENNPG